MAGASGTKRFLYDGDKLVAEYDASGNVTARYVHGAGTDEPLVWYEGPGIGDRRYLHSDERGSITGIAGVDGRIRTINSYDAWGITALTNQGRFGYTGQVWLPELGMWYYKARIYSPTLGRFMQTDPIGYEGGLHHYAYASNDPVNNTDPSGLLDVFNCGGQNDGYVSSSCSSGSLLDAEAVQQNRALQREIIKSIEQANMSSRTTGNALVDSVLPVGGTVSSDQTGVVLDAAEAAANQYPILNSLLGQAIPFLRGIAIHAVFAANIRALGLPEYNAEISYKDGRVVPYGTPGSIRADAVEGPIGSPRIAYELKTGGAYVSVREYNNYKKNLPIGTSLQVINVR